MPNQKTLSQRRIQIFLNESNDAKKFSSEEQNLIHQLEFEKVCEFIDQGIKKAISEPNTRHVHNTITVSGTRGSGKTSFLLSLKEKYDNDARICVLKIIDPTLIEEKGHVFLNIISVISDLIDEKLKKNELNDNGNRYAKKEWRDRLERLAKGIPSIDGIGNNNLESWQDPVFVMDNGLEAVKAARHLEENFSSLLEYASKLLECKAFLLIFDDIDVDVSKGWKVLETIRKYITTTKMITVLSGDPELYSLLVRQQKWNNFSDKILKYEGEMLNRLDFLNAQITELESQYLLKVLPVRYRVHLSTLYEKINSPTNIPIEVAANKGDINSHEIKDCYKKIFGFFGIKNSTQEEVYSTFMLNLPLRTQIQFLRLLWNKSNNKANDEDINVTNIFMSELLEKKINIGLASSSAKYINALTLDFLIKERKLNDLYQLQPATRDNTLNSCLIALNLLISEFIYKNNTFLSFEFLIKIGLIRNILTLIQYKNSENSGPSEPSIEDLCEKAGLFNDIVLRDATSCIEGYLYGYYERNGGAKNITVSFVQLLGLNKSSKYIDRIDYVFSEKISNDDERILGCMPCFTGTYNYKNESRVLFSIYPLIASICDIIKTYETIDKELSEEELKPILITKLKELSQIRSYPIPSFGFTNNSQPVPDSNDDLPESNDMGNLGSFDRTVNILAVKIIRWLKAVEHLKVSPHLLGKISTRFFYAMNNIKDGYTKTMKLGDLFHFQIVALLNAVLIEDVRENSNNIGYININNTNYSDNIFKFNLTRLNKLAMDEKTSDYTFSRWFLSCPLLVPYLKKDELLKENLIEYCREFLHQGSFNGSLNEKLNDVAIKGTTESEIETDSETAIDQYSLVNILKSRKVPFYLFDESDTRHSVAKKNGIIKKYAILSPIFKNDRRTARRIREFRRFLKENNIKW